MTATDVRHAAGSTATQGIARAPGELLHSPERVHAVLRMLPSHGWTAGWIGRRDRALLVLSQLACLSYGQIASLTAGDVTIADGTARISTTGGTTTMRKVDDDLLCGPCALARWVHALDLTVVYHDGRVIAAVIARAVPLKADSPHLCHSNNSITEVTRQVVLLPPIDQWGHPVRSVLPRDPALERPLASLAHGTVPVRRLRNPADDESSDRANGLERRLEELLASGSPA